MGQNRVDTIGFPGILLRLLFCSTTHSDVSGFSRVSSGWEVKGRKALFKWTAITLLWAQLCVVPAQMLSGNARLCLTGPLSVVVSQRIKHDF